MRPELIKCTCPECRTTYRVPATAAGRHAKCRACGRTFRIRKRVWHAPTEDDIIRWLREADDEEEAAMERPQATPDDSLAGSAPEPDACPARKRLSA